MTKASQFTDFADALDTAANTDRELHVDVDDIPLGRPVRLVDPDNLTVWGRGNRSRVRPSAALGKATWVHVGSSTAAGGCENLLFEDFAVVPDATPTDGWALRLTRVGRAQVCNVDISGNSSQTPHLAHGGILLEGFDKFEIAHSNVYARRCGLRAHGEKGQAWGADLTMGTDTKIQTHRRPDHADALSNSAPGVHIAGSAGGIYLGGNIIYAGLGVLVDTTATGEQNREVFLQPGLIVDSCLEDGIRAMPNSFGLIHGTGFWSCSNGRAGGDGDGVSIEGPQLANAVVQLTGPHLFNNRRDGLAVNGGFLALSNPVFRNNRGHDLHIPNGGVRGYADPMGFPVPPAKIRNAAAGFRVGAVYP